jgi:pimeloyl-ACP methyl ester carboxylesterase
MKEKDTVVNGLKINFKVLGEGDPLLILHGWGSSSDSWQEVQKILSNNGYKVIVPDLPGFGKSAPPKEVWGVRNYSDFIISLIKKLELSQFFLLGHSFGGRIAIKFANRYPERLKALILCDSAGIKQPAGKETLLVYLMARTGNIIFSRRPLKRFKAAMQNLFYTLIRNRDYAKANGIMRDIIKKVLKEDLLPELSHIKTKTLLIWGQRDNIIPIKYAYLFQEKLVNSRLEILPKIGHSPQLETPKKLSAIILSFLKE